MDWITIQQRVEKLFVEMKWLLFNYTSHSFVFAFSFKLNWNENLWQLVEIISIQMKNAFTTTHTHTHDPPFKIYASHNIRRLRIIIKCEMQKKKLHEAFKAQLNRKFFKTSTPQAQQTALRILLLTKMKKKTRIQNWLWIYIQFHSCLMCIQWLANGSMSATLQ